MQQNGSPQLYKDKIEQLFQAIDKLYSRESLVSSNPNLQSIKTYNDILQELEQQILLYEKYCQNDRDYFQNKSDYELRLQRFEDVKFGFNWNITKSISSSTGSFIQQISGIQKQGDKLLQEADQKIQNIKTNLKDIKQKVQEIDYMVIDQWKDLLLINTKIQSANSLSKSIKQTATKLISQLGKRKFFKVMILINIIVIFILFGYIAYLRFNQIKIDVKNIGSKKDFYGNEIKQQEKQISNIQQMTQQNINHLGKQNTQKQQYQTPAQIQENIILKQQQNSKDKKDILNAPNKPLFL